MKRNFMAVNMTINVIMMDVTGIAFTDAVRTTGVSIFELQNHNFADRLLS